MNEIKDIYKPFISDGYITSIKDYRRRRLIRILRNTGASQSLLLKRHLLGGLKTATNRRTSIRGMGDKILNISLHQHRIKLNIVTLVNA